MGGTPLLSLYLWILSTLVEVPVLVYVEEGSVFIWIVWAEAR